MLTGMIGNALGWHHGFRPAAKPANPDRLRRAVGHASAQGMNHTVDLNSPKMTALVGLRARGEHRGGGRPQNMEHTRYRHYLVDGLMTVALGLQATAILILTQ